METTATTWNRQRDRQALEAALGLPESPPATGDEPVRFFTFDGDPPLLLATGYRRVVYGDHGPYVEFDRDHVNWDAFTEKNEEKAQRAPQRYYDEYFASAGDGCARVMLYDQLRDVKGKRHPPRDGKRAAVFHHCSAGAGDGAGAGAAGSSTADAEDGYADYVVGCLYLDPANLRVAMPRAAATSAQKPPGKKKKQRLQ